MSTQDDTFRKLAQRPFEEVRLMVRDMQNRKLSAHKVEVALNNRGWSIKEYRQHHIDVLKHECDLAFLKAFGQVSLNLESLNQNENTVS